MNPVEWLIYAAAYGVLLNRHVSHLPAGRCSASALVAAIDIVNEVEEEA